MMPFIAKFNHLICSVSNSDTICQAGTTKFGDNNRLDQKVFDGFARQIVSVQDIGIQVVVVSSGAIAAGKDRLCSLQIDPQKFTKKELAGIGARHLLNKWGSAFEKLGIKPPIMSQELEEKLCNLFTEIQPAYAKYCPKERVNFLNYYYTIYKLCELLNEQQFLPYFPMLKDREKRMEQDCIWKKICKATSL